MTTQQPSSTVATSADKPRKPARRFRMWWVVLLVLLILLCRFFVIDVQCVQTDAMSPTLRVGQWMLLQKMCTPRVGDVVLFRLPEQQGGGFSMARVAATPGDSLCMSAGELFVNGTRQTFPLNTGAGVSYAMRMPTPKAPYRLTLPSLVSMRDAIITESDKMARIDSGKLYIDGRIRSHFTFLKSYYWLLTDMVTSGPDSRVVGPIARDAIEGVVIVF